MRSSTIRKKKHTMNKTYRKKEKENSPSFLSCCFYSFDNSKSKLAKVFTTISKSNAPIFIIDYANIIHILFEHFHSIDKTIRYLYLFLHNQLKNGSTFILVTKKVKLGNTMLDILEVLEKGKQLTGKTIDETYFAKEKINIYHVDYHDKVSSSIDDIFTWFFMVVLFRHVTKEKVHLEPRKYKGFPFPLSKVNLLSNDKQFMDKHLFGKTPEEGNHKTIAFGKIVVKDGKYVLFQDVKENQQVMDFLQTFFITRVDDTQDLECRLSLLLEILLSKKKKEEPLGYFRQNGYPEYNPHFLQEDIRNSVWLDYSKANQKVQEYLSKTEMHLCKKQSSLLDTAGNLKPLYYMYAYIKYIQMYMFSLTNEGKVYGDFYGGFSKEQLFSLFPKV